MRKCSHLRLLLLVHQCLIQRLFLNKGDKPCTTKEISTKLSKQWKTKGQWHMIPLGRGFYEYSFSSDNDVRTSLAMGTINLQSGLLRLSRWSKDFNKYSQRLTHAQVWIRLLDLPHEYWLERMLMKFLVQWAPLSLLTPQLKNVLLAITRGCWWI